MKILVKCLLIFNFTLAVFSCTSNLFIKKSTSSIDLYVMPISGFTRFNIDSTNIKNVCAVSKTIDNSKLLSNIEKWMNDTKMSSIDSFSYDNIRSMIVFNREKNVSTSMQVDVSGKVLWGSKVYILDKKGLYLILEPLSKEQRNNILKKMPMHQW
ncbi:hypothetical protein HNQ93_002391 [Hymenobacter luteus]|uniref:DUF4252 domain-containing protein n=2 Tax=Hymenobacter TaxID=89966 RepID=A0A7W9T161_9BACT|nr:MULTISPECIES: hypothetical protein [Hymenobacter]MBB4602040.1 hypothetical protein [Hymenobacter latericoloratus]MBB6059531.1 hypothetical protein [Hymenobacter luteus]